MKSAPTNMKEEELELSQMQSQHTDANKDAPGNLNALTSAEVDKPEDEEDKESEVERMLSAPADIFQTSQAPPIAKVDALKNAK